MRERNILRERRNSPRQFSNILFLTDNTEEQNTQHSTETLSQPISQNVTATEASPPTPLRMEKGVITEIPLHVLRMLSSPSPPITSPIGVTSHTTPLSIRRGAGGEASVFSVCRRRSVGLKRWWKSSVKSVSSVRERNILRERRNSPRQFSNILFLTDNTEEQNTQHSTETLSQPISQNVTANVS